MKIKISYWKEKNSAKILNDFSIDEEDEFFSVLANIKDQTDRYLIYLFHDDYYLIKVDDKQDFAELIRLISEKLEVEILN